MLKLFSLSAWWPSAFLAWARSLSLWIRYGPVTDNAQSVYELSLIENVPNVVQEVKKDFNIDVKIRACQRAVGRKRRCGKHIQSHG
jgi:hypothetical protein